MRRILAAAAVTGIALAVALAGSPASASPSSAASVSSSASTAAAAAPGTAAADEHPCGARFTHSRLNISVQNCPDWAPAQIPVFAGVSTDTANVGSIDPAGNDWYRCQAQGESYSHPFGYENNWWARTMADNGRWGWVNQVFFRGGANNEPDANLARCDSGRT